MIQEEIFQLDKKIKQITGTIDRRKEKASEWNPNYKKILQEKHDTYTYLQKKCPSKLILKERNSLQTEQCKQLLSQHCAQSRQKIRTFYNELKELDLLQKKKNKIRLMNAKQKLDHQNKVPQIMMETRQKSEKIGSNETQQTQLCSRTLKDRFNPFAGCKAEKFIEFYQQNKNSDEQLGLKLMRHLGVGVQNTPIGPSLKKEQRKDQLKGKKDSNWKTGNFRSSSYKKNFISSFNEKQRWFKPNTSKNMFEDRIRKIIKYHGDFWNEDLDVLQ